MAHLSDDAGLLKAFAEDRDIHTATASEVFGVPLDAVDAEQRRMAKVINFGLIYGMSAFGLYFARYPGVADYMQRTRETARQQGYVETVFGRRLYLPEINSKNPQRRQGAERAAINAPMQGTAADLIKLAMIAVQERRRADPGSAGGRNRAHPRRAARTDVQRGQAQGAVARRPRHRQQLGSRALTAAGTILETAVDRSVPLRTSHEY